MHSSTATRPRRPRGRPWRLAVGAIALAMPLAACGTADQPEAPETDTGGSEEELLDQATVPQLDWTDCEDGWECATAQVPLDYDDPEGELIELALVRLPAVDPDQRIGSLFLNPGGPGASGVDNARSLVPEYFPKQVRDRFDVIGLDPRGVARSTPVQCFDDATERSVGLDAVAGYPVDDAAADEQFQAAAALAAGCGEHSGELLNHLSTANVARDLEMLRRAVGDEQLSYHGLSYGSYLGATYAAMFPDRVRAAVLDGVLEPTAYTGADSPDGTLPWLRVGNDMATDETLGELFRLCAEAGEVCPLGVDGDPEAKFAEILEALDEEPMTIEDPDLGDYEIGADAISVRTQTKLAAPSWWAGEALFLHELHQLLVVDGDRDAALAHYLEVLNAEAEAAPAPDPDAPAPNQLESNLASLCVDVEHADDVDQIAAAAQEATDRAPYGAERWAWVTAACASWPGVDEDRWTGPFAASTDQPLLVVGTQHDPNTAYRNAVSFAAELPSAGLLTLEGWGHTASFQGRSTCIDDAVAAYLIDGAMPADGATCAPDPLGVPFTSTDQGA